MRNLDGRSIAVGVLIGVAAAVSVGAASMPPSSPKCPWRLGVTSGPPVAWRLNTGTGQLEVCTFQTEASGTGFTWAGCEPMPASAVPSSVIEHNAKGMYRLYHRLPPPAPAAGPRD